MAIIPVITKPLGLNHSPLALYLFENDLTDSSGNSNDLTLDVGTSTFVELTDDLTAFSFDGATGLVLDTGNSPFRILGDVTMEIVIRYVSTAESTKAVFGQTATSNDTNDTTNFLYRMSLGSTGNLAYFAERNSGVNIQYNAGLSIEDTGILQHLAIVRENDEVSIYVDGVLTPAGMSSGLDGPTGGSVTKFRFGYDLDSGDSPFHFYTGLMTSAKIIASALSAAEILAEFESLFAVQVPVIDSESFRFQVQALIDYLPGGKVWQAKRVAASGNESVLRKFMRALATEMLRETEAINLFKVELNPDRTTLYVDEWERAVGIPDGCFLGTGTLDERRTDVLTKLSSLGVQTQSDFIVLAQKFNLDIQIATGVDHGALPFQLPFLLFTGASDPRFTIVVTYDIPSAVSFPYTFPIPFTTQGLSILECLFNKLKPANTQVVFVANTS